MTLLIPKEERPPSCPNLSPLDFGMFSYLENDIYRRQFDSPPAINSVVLLPLVWRLTATGQIQNKLLKWLTDA